MAPWPPLRVYPAESIQLSCVWSLREKDSDDFFRCLEHLRLGGEVDLDSEEVMTTPPLPTVEIVTSEDI